MRSLVSALGRLFVVAFLGGFVAPLQAADFSVFVSRIQSNFYRVTGERIVVETRSCFEYAYADSAVLSVSTTTGAGELRFNSGARCQVTNLFYGQDLDAGQYSMAVTGSDTLFATTDGQWLFQTLFYCSYASAGRAALLNLSSRASGGNAYGTLTISGSPSCMMDWVYRSVRSSSLLPGVELRPDLVVDLFTVPAQATAGQQMLLTVATRNRGNVGSDPSKTRMYLSLDASKSADDVELGYCDAGSLAVNETRTCSGTVNLPLTLAAGSYYAIAVADADQDVPESDGSNNHRVASNLVQISGVTGFPLSLSKSGAGAGQVSSVDGLVDCPSTRLSCSPTVTRDSEVVLTAAPSFGSLFTGWTGACSGLGECRVTMSQTRAVTANFAVAGAVQQISWFSQAEGYISRFALVNTSDRTLTYNFVLHTEGGNSLVLDPAQAQATLPARTQRIVEVSQLVRSFANQRRAMVVLSSDGQEAELTALYNLVQPSTGSVSNLAFQRVADRQATSSQLTLPWLTVDSAYRTELVLSNSSDRPATGTLSALPAVAGAAQLKRNVLTVPAKSQLAVPAAELLSMTQGNASGLTLSVDAASGHVRGSYVMTHQQTQATNVTDLVNPSAQASGSTVMVVPWFSIAEGYESRFVLVNRSSSPANFSVEVRGEPGNVLGIGIAGGVVPANGQLDIPARSVLTSVSGGLPRASAIFTVAAPPSQIEGSYRVQSVATGALNQTAMVKPSTTGGSVAKLVLPWFSRAEGYISRFVLVNRSATDAPFTVEVLPEVGNAVKAQIVSGGTVPARGMVVLLASQLVTAFEKMPRAAAVFRVQAPDDQIEALYNIVNPATGSVSNTLLVHAPAESGAAPVVPMQVQKAPYTDLQGNRAVGFVDASDALGRPLVFSLVGAPSRGSLELDSVSGRFVYTPLPGQGLASDRFTVNVFNGVSSRQVAVDVLPLGDPLAAAQWHLRNVGQSAYSSVLPVAGFDLNVEGAWALGYSGQGVKIGIVDDGLELGHPDLIARVDQANSRNFLTGGTDPSPTSYSDNHGTMVAGIAGATGFNGIGTRGVAWQARLRGYNYLKNQSLTTFANSIGSASYSADNDVFNLSLGMVTNALPSFSGDYQAATAVAMAMRGGKGAPLVAAAGNNFVHDGSSDGDCEKANFYGVSCLDPATWERNGGSYPILVGAIRGDGRRSSYSSTGSSLWVSAPGGEYGYDASLKPGLSESKSYEPAIVTTSMRGCGKPDTPLNALDTFGGNASAPQCEYTAAMNGTSAAAPAVSGVVALMLQANPRLTNRDVKHILASTARRVDPNHSGKRVSGVLSDGTLDLELGWQRNAAGYWFNTWYGFGAVDAQRAVQMARDTRTLLPPQSERGGSYIYRAPANAIVPRGVARGLEVAFPVAETATTVESVVLFFSLSQTPSLSCNQIELISPSGTRSIVLHAFKGFTNRSVDNSRMVTHAFYGEPLNGRWLLRYLDVCSGGVPTVLDAGIDQSLLFVAR